MIDDKVLCSHTLETFNECQCVKCASVRDIIKIMEEVPEEGTDQANIFDTTIAHLVFPPEPGESFEDIMKNAQK